LNLVAGSYTEHVKLRLVSEVKPPEDKKLLIQEGKNPEDFISPKTVCSSNEFR